VLTIQGAWCDIPIYLGVYLSQSARTPSEIECFQHQPASTVRVACNLRFRNQAPCPVFQHFVFHGCPPFCDSLRPPFNGPNDSQKVSDQNGDWGFTACARQARFGEGAMVKNGLHAILIGTPSLNNLPQIH
jgi:hypothetical protein